ncbi:MAG: hypothetical protein MZW92_19530 [Comamonadaceae bacterium]|nr:hypothetical protein [Comamonadaceae bacterium]
MDGRAEAARSARSWAPPPAGQRGPGLGCGVRHRLREGRLTRASTTSRPSSIDGKPAHLSQPARQGAADRQHRQRAAASRRSSPGSRSCGRRYRDRGLVVVGFPSNEFGGQDPGSNDEIASFCQLNYGVSFPMMAKVQGQRRRGRTRCGSGSTAEAPGLLGTAGDEVELHQVPGRPRRPGDQALRADRHARTRCAGRHREGAGAHELSSPTSSPTPATRS